MPTVLITGANRGVGLEAAAQLAASGKFDKVIVTVRSKPKGPPAVAAVSLLSKQPESTFETVAVDLCDHASVRTAVAALPSRLDAVVLNAGGLLGEELTEHGVTENFASNVLGHVVLLEGLLAAGKVQSGARIIYSHSETTRSVWMFTGFQPFVRMQKEDIEGSLARPPSAGAYGVPVRQRMNTYANSKLIGGLWLSALAKEHPDVYFASVSPGGCGTDVYAAVPQPMPFLMGQPAVIRVLTALGVCHPATAAATKDVDLPPEGTDENPQTPP
eukprot:gene27924-5672_t